MQKRGASWTAFPDNTATEFQGLQMTILFISGVNDRSLMGVDLDERGNLFHLMDGNCSVHHRLPLKQGVDLQMVLFGKGVKQRGIEFRTPPSLIFTSTPG